MIPRIVHRIWFDQTVPHQYEANWRKMKRLHPGWEFKTWSDSSKLAPLLHNRWLFENFTKKPESYGFRADIARYEILARYGGIYVDTDVEPLRPFATLLGKDPFIGWCSDTELDPSIIASPPQHPAILALVHGLNDVEQWVRRGGPVSPPSSTGPAYVTRLWRARDDVRRFPPHTFFPYHWADPESGHQHPPWPKETVAVHHWAAGWKPKDAQLTSAHNPELEVIRI